MPVRGIGLVPAFYQGVKKPHWSEEAIWLKTTLSGDVEPASANLKIEK
jgi:hypothetical protein